MLALTRIMNLPDAGRPVGRGPPHIVATPTLLAGSTSATPNRLSMRILARPPSADMVIFIEALDPAGADADAVCRRFRFVNASSINSIGHRSWSGEHESSSPPMLSVGLVVMLLRYEATEEILCSFTVSEPRLPDFEAHVLTWGQNGLVEDDAPKSAHETEYLYPMC